MDIFTVYYMIVIIIFLMMGSILLYVRMREPVEKKKDEYVAYRG